MQRRGEALQVNISAGEGLQNVLKSNLGPSGTIKMFVESTVSIKDNCLRTSGSLMEQEPYVKIYRFLH